MNEKPSLGLFLSKNKAVAVWVSFGSDNSAIRTQTITPSEEEASVIALRAAKAVIQQSEEFDEAFVAIDCGLYTQYKLQSEFDDYHQIESTIKYDAEEAAATDATNLAVAFDITGKAPVGSEVTVYTADRQLLTDMVLDMQEGTLDPGFMEPDVVCLARALSSCAGLSEQTEAMFVVLSESSCYMIRPKGNHSPAGRTFLIGAGQDVTGILARELLLANSSSDPDQPMTSVVLIGKLDSVDTNLLAQRTGLEIKTACPEKALFKTLDNDELTSPHELLIAYGAALAGRIRGHKTDFRKDFMPYQGRRKAVESNLRIISIALTILLVAVAVFFQLKTFRMKSSTRQLRSKLIAEHKKIGLRAKKNESFGSRYSTLSRAIRNAKQMQEGGGPGGDKSVPGKLTSFFEALNNTPKEVDVQIQQISITERLMKVKGDTNSHSATLSFIDEIKKHPRITTNGETYKANVNRDSFQFNIEPKKEAGTGKRR